jgi:tRNA threonylcarbamoyladenosine biosynthesis protein TsaB
VALGRLMGNSAESIAQTELAGRSYSATLVAAIEDLLAGQRMPLRDLGCIVVVKGPGSFTGVRVGLSAAKGLSEGTGVPVAAVSRLEVLAAKAEVGSAALDAHRHELFLRLPDADNLENPRELLAGAEELARIQAPSRIAVADNAAAALIQQAWRAVELVQVSPPTAAEALRFAAAAVAASQFVDVALLDGHYLRRSDAEIFGNTVMKS